MSSVRLGVIGIGGMGSHHLTYINSLEGASLTAICDVEPQRLAAAGARYAVPKFERWQDLVSSGLCDAVLIATPHYFHTPIAAGAFEARLHVLCEKPVAVTVGAAREINQVAARHPTRKFGIMFQMRTSPLQMKVRELIRDGELGTLKRMTWTATDWFRTWSYYASGGWRATWSGEGGGVLLNQCPHNLDQIHWLSGLKPARVTAVASIAKTHPIEVEDEVSAIIEFEGGAIGHFITTTGEAPGTNRLELAGDRGLLIAEQGRITFRRTRQSVQAFNQTSPKSFDTPESWDIDIPFNKSQPEGHRVITQNFVNAILKDEPLISPGEDGLAALELGNAMLLSGLSRRSVDLPLDAGEYDAFIKDLTARYGGKKTLGTQANVHDMTASFKH